MNKITPQEVSELLAQAESNEGYTGTIALQARAGSMAVLIGELQAKLSEAEKLIAKYQKHVEIIKDDSEPSVGDLCIDYSGGIYKAESRNLNECFEIIQLANGKYAVRESDFNNNQQGE
jgi:hypothetical protein